MKRKGDAIHPAEVTPRVYTRGSAKERPPLKAGCRGFRMRKPQRFTHGGQFLHFRSCCCFGVPLLLVQYICSHLLILGCPHGKIAVPLLPCEAPVLRACTAQPVCGSNLQLAYDVRHHFRDREFPQYMHMVLDSVHEWMPHANIHQHSSQIGVEAREFFLADIDSACMKHQVSVIHDERMPHNILHGITGNEQRQSRSSVSPAPRFAGCIPLLSHGCKPVGQPPLKRLGTEPRSAGWMASPSNRVSDLCPNTQQLNIKTAFFMPFLCLIM